MIDIFFDGLCEPAYKGGKRNPEGVATYGYIIYRDWKVIAKGYSAIGEGKGMTNNVAEFSALEEAVKWLREQGIEDEMRIKGDSMLVINQMKGEWQVKSDTSKKFVPLIRDLLKDRKVKFTWIPRDENEAADALSRIAYANYLKNRNGEK